LIMQRRIIRYIRVNDQLQRRSNDEKQNHILEFWMLHTFVAEYPEGILFREHKQRIGALDP